MRKLLLDVRDLAGAPGVRRLKPGTGRGGMNGSNKVAKILWVPLERVVEWERLDEDRSRRNGRREIGGGDERKDRARSQ